MVIVQSSCHRKLFEKFRFWWNHQDKSCFQVIWNNRSITPSTQKVLWNGGGGVLRGLQPLVDGTASSFISSVREIFPCESFFPIITSLVKKLSTPFVWSVPGCGELWWGRNYCMIILSPPIIRRENDMPPPLQLQRMMYVFPLEYWRRTVWVNVSQNYYQHRFYFLNLWNAQ